MFNRLDRAFKTDHPKKFHDVITQDEINHVFWPAVLLLFVTIIILPFLVRILTLYAVNGIATVVAGYPLQVSSLLRVAALKSNQ